MCDAWNDASPARMLSTGLRVGSGLASARPLKLARNSTKASMAHRSCSARWYLVYSGVASTHAVSCLELFFEFLDYALDEFSETRGRSDKLEAKRIFERGMLILAAQACLFAAMTYSRAGVLLLS